jgi:putative redox protein
MKHVVDLSWKSNLAFETDLDGHKLIIDASKEGGGDDLGPRPKKLMLVALAGCTGVDVIMILRKMKIEPEDFHVLVEGDVTDDHPKKYHTMKIIYQFRGKDLPYEKLERAVQLSQEKYCGVSATYREALNLQTEIRIVE